MLIYSSKLRFFGRFCLVSHSPKRISTTCYEVPLIKPEKGGNLITAKYLLANIHEKSIYQEEIELLT